MLEENTSVPVLVRIEPDVEEWGSRDDDRWREDLFELSDALRRDLADAVKVPPPRDAKKSGLELVPIIVALGSAGVFTAMVEIVKAWLVAKPGRRRVSVQYEVERGGVVEKGTVTVDADNVDGNALTTLAAEALPARS